MTLLYADDIVLVGYREEPLQECMDSVARVGARYGLELHWVEIKLFQVNTNKKLKAPGGDTISSKDSILYLGTTLSADSGVGNELSRRLGKAGAEYRVLSKFWKHSSVPIARKIEVFQAAVISTLLHGLSTVWLNKAQQRQLNGFHARCLRDIQRIPHPQESRISNQVVLERAGQVELSRQLLKRQLTLFGRIPRAPDSDQRRQLTFCPGTLRLVAHQFVRRVGRPR